MLFTWTFEGQTCFTVFVSNELTYNFCQRKNLTKYWEKKLFQKNWDFADWKEENWEWLDLVLCFFSQLFLLQKMFQFFLLAFRHFNLLKKKMFSLRTILNKSSKCIFCFCLLKSFQQYLFANTFIMAYRISSVLTQ
jgi:hypothetical protein